MKRDPASMTAIKQVPKNRQNEMEIIKKVFVSDRHRQLVFINAGISFMSLCFIRWFHRKLVF